MKVLFCGLGSVGQRHLRNLLQMSIPDLEISAYRARGQQITLKPDMTVDEGVLLTQKYDFHTFESLGDALACRPDVVFITNPSGMHRDTLKSVIESTSANVFVEKPLAHTLEGLAEITKTVKDKGITVFTGFQNRFHPCIRKAKELLETRVIGEIIAVNIEFAEYMPGSHKYEDYRQSYTSVKALGGGVVLSYIHELDYAYHLFGMPKSVYALGGKLSDLEIDVEDTASILLSCEHRPQGVQLPQGTQFPVHVHLDFLQNPPSRCCKIIGTRGKIEFDLLKPSFVCYDQTGNVSFEDGFQGFERNDMFIEEMKLFFSICRGEAEPILDMDDGMQSLKIALAAKQSMETGEVVVL